MHVRYVRMLTRNCEILLISVINLKSRNRAACVTTDECAGETRDGIRAMKHENSQLSIKG